jgi:hypothetical protein
MFSTWILYQRGCGGCGCGDKKVFQLALFLNILGVEKYHFRVLLGVLVLAVRFHVTRSHDKSHRDTDNYDFSSLVYSSRRRWS